MYQNLHFKNLILKLYFLYRAWVTESNKIIFLKLVEMLKFQELSCYTCNTCGQFTFQTKHVFSDRLLAEQKSTVRFHYYFIPLASSYLMSILHLHNIIYSIFFFLKNLLIFRSILVKFPQSGPQAYEDLLLVCFTQIEDFCCGTITVFGFILKCYFHVSCSKPCRQCYKLPNQTQISFRESA